MDDTLNLLIQNEVRITLQTYIDSINLLSARMRSSIKIIIIMSKLLLQTRSPPRLKQENPETEPNININESSELAKEEKLNAELLRVRSQQLLKQVSQAWQMNEQQLCDFFASFDSPYPIAKVNSLIGSDGVKLVRTEHKIFLGQIKEKRKHGRGITIYRDGKIYEGLYSQNEKSGDGMQVYGNGNMYVGQYHQNKKHGKGTFFWFSLCESPATKQASPKVQHYQGQWWGGLPDGEGQHEKANGDFYLGHFKNGLKHGQGVQYYANGDKYSGNFINGLPQGHGEYTWADGTSYRGDFKQGYRNGYGVWLNSPPSEENYKGHYMLDKKHGFGIYDWGNGYYYKGGFIEDQRCGQGQLFYREELVYSGFWVNGEKCEEEDFQSRQLVPGTSLRLTKISTEKKHEKPNNGSIQLKLKLKQKSPDKLGKSKGQTDSSFLINFKHMQEIPPRRVCSRNCTACKKKEHKTKQKRNGSRQRHT